MVIEFSIYPLGKVHLAEPLAEMVKILDKHQVKYTMGPMGTTVQGDWDKLMPVIKECHEFFAQDSDRIVTHITIDDKKRGDDSLGGRVESIESKVGHAV